MGSNYRNWVDDTFKLLHDKGTQTLIIDLRGNGGGDDNYVAALVSCLTDKPFRFYDHIDVNTVTPTFKDQLDFHLSPERLKEFRDGLAPNPQGGYRLTIPLHQGLAEQQPAKYPFLGKVFVLMDGGSFSGAADFCAVVHHLQRATFIGEETGGGYYGNNSGMMPTLTLPISKLQVRLPLYSYWNAVPGYDAKNHGVRPDYLVEMKVADILNGIDAPLQKALQLAN
jgi:C-terminal processing protease CtpA/Prc